jgi:hypothetical protein
MVTGHGNIKSYLHRFKIIEAPNCPCGNDNQTTEHIILGRALVNEDRERLIAAVAKKDNWPINTDMLIKKHYKAFAKFTKQQTKSKKLTHKTEQNIQEYSNKLTRRRPTDKQEIKTKNNEETINVNTKCI